MSVRIHQCRVASCVSFFEAALREKYGLPRAYADPTSPAVFFGCYPNTPQRNRRDIETVATHQALGIVIWAGSDALTLRKAPAAYQKVLRNRKLRHVAISKYVSESLICAGVRHLYLPICPTPVHSFYRPGCPLGDSVYVYSSHNAPAFYGAPIVDELRKRLPNVKVIVRYSTPPDSTPWASMPDLYASCFMGLRLTPHDGLANTVVELGLMGRRCVWNGWLSSAIPWSGVDDVIRIVGEERSRIGTVQPDVAKSVLDDITLPEDWLQTGFWR